MSEEYREKLKTLGFGTKRGQSETRRIESEIDGSTAGVVTEHWDGSQDAAARPKPVRIKNVMRLVEEE